MNDVVYYYVKMTKAINCNLSTLKSQELDQSATVEDDTTIHTYNDDLQAGDDFTLYFM